MTDLNYNEINHEDYLGNTGNRYWDRPQKNAIVQINDWGVQSKDEKTYTEISMQCLNGDNEGKVGRVRIYHSAPYIKNDGTKSQGTLWRIRHILISIGLGTKNDEGVTILPESFNKKDVLGKCFIVDIVQQQPFNTSGKAFFEIGINVAPIPKYTTPIESELHVMPLSSNELSYREAPQEAPFL